MAVFLKHMYVYGNKKWEKQYPSTKIDYLLSLFLFQANFILRFFLLHETDNNNEQREGKKYLNFFIVLFLPAYKHFISSNDCFFSDFCCSHTHTHTHTHTHVYIYIYISKVGDRSRGRREGSLFNRYYTEVYGRALLLSLDRPNLPLICTLYYWVLSKAVSSTIFRVFGMTRPGIQPRSPGPLANTLPTRTLSRLSVFNPRKIDLFCRNPR